MIAIGPAGFMVGPLSEEAQEARRPPPQWLLLGAERDEAKSLALVSGGERVYINEAMTRALALYQAQASGRRYECLFADESDGALDVEKKRQFARMKRRVLEIGKYRREIYITHSAEVLEAADAVIDMTAFRRPAARAA